MPTILMVGDRDRALETWAGVLHDAGYDVTTAPSADAALALARAHTADAIVTNLHCTDMPAAQLLQQLAAATKGQLPIVIPPQPNARADLNGEVRVPQDVGPHTAREAEVIDELDRALSVNAHAPDGTAPARVIVVARNRLLRDALETALLAAGDLDVVLTAGGAEQVSPEIVSRCMADVILMDVASAATETIDHVRGLSEACPHLRLVIMDIIHAAEDLVAMLEAGASALLLKRATVDEIVRTTRAVLGGATVIPQSLTATLFSVVAERRRQADIAEWQVTRREHEIIEFIAEGLSNKEIASRLNIATFTVKSHVHNVLQKLGLRTRGEIARSVLLSGRPHGTRFTLIPFGAPKRSLATTAHRSGCA